MGYQDGRRYGRNDYGDRFRSDSGYRDDRDRNDRGRYGSGGDYRRPPSNYDYDDRGFFDRAGDEVRSWFGDEEAERRREYDDYLNRRYGDPRDQSSRVGFAPNSTGGFEPYSRQDSGFASARYGERENYGPQHDFGQYHDSNYQAWRRERLSELDRDYAEYQQENRSRFDNEFGTWRNRRTEQRSSLSQVQEHMEVVGSDGSHVGTVDKIAGDRIILTKNDSDAGGQHHSIPSRWIATVDAKTVTLEKTADQAKDHWRTEKERQALFGDEQSRRDAYGSQSWTSRAYTRNS
ncbi:MAG TPA: DUF2171 domain-containing protein [Sphingobium sp.]